MSHTDTDYTEYTLGRAREEVVDQEVELSQIKRLQEAENAEVSERYLNQLDGRGRRSTLSPSYINSLPRTLAEKLHVTPEEEEHILYLFAATYSVHQTAKSAGVTQDKVRSVVYNPLFRERIQTHRDEMRLSVLSKIEESQMVLLDAIQDPEKLKNASITQISEVFQEISETQGNMISSLRETNSAIHEVDPIKMFTGDELEYMTMLRRRLSMGPGNNGPKDPPNLDAPLDSIEVDFSITEGSVIGSGPQDNGESTSVESPTADDGYWIEEASKARNSVTQTDTTETEPESEEYSERTQLYHTLMSPPEEVVD